MSSDKYKHFHLLSVEDLVSFIERKDAEIINLNKEIEKCKESRDKYYDYNQFHIEEISRLDKIIGEYKNKR
jgi:hypothetical protein